METEASPVLLGLICLVAFLYSSVGHAGASGYIAVLSLAGWPTAEIRPLSLILNVLVAAVATIRFSRAGYFKRELFLPFALLSVPGAVLGGYLKLPAPLLSRCMGVVLSFSAVWMLIGKREPLDSAPPSRGTAVCVGGMIGVLAGVTGTGGGIFLSPLMVFCRWGRLKEISAAAAPFILVNSLAGLAGLGLAGYSPPPAWYCYLAVVVVGGSCGSALGARKLSARVIQWLLSTVLLIAGIKLLLY